MDTSTTDNIKVCLAKLSVEALTAFKVKLSKLYDFKKYPTTLSDDQINEASRVAEKNINQLLAKAVPDVLAISESPEAFHLVRDAAISHLLDLERATEQDAGITLPATTLKVISVRFNAVREYTYGNLENYRSNFTGSRNMGGRPKEIDWESPLIHLIAVANTSDGLEKIGDKQVDLENYIDDWFAKNRVKRRPKDSEIRKRASEIFKAISKS